MPVDGTWRVISEQCSRKGCEAEPTEVIVTTNWDDRTTSVLTLCRTCAKALELHMRKQGAKDLAIA